MKVFVTVDGCHAGSITNCCGPDAGRPCPFVRVSFASASHEDLALGMQRLAAVLRAELAGGNAYPTPGADPAADRPAGGAEPLANGAAKHSGEAAGAHAGAFGCSSDAAAAACGEPDQARELDQARAAAAAALRNAATSTIGIAPGSAAVIGLQAGACERINRLALDAGAQPGAR